MIYMGPLLRHSRRVHTPYVVSFVWASIAYNRNEMLHADFCSILKFIHIIYPTDFISYANLYSKWVASDESLRQMCRTLFEFSWSTQISGFLLWWKNRPVLGPSHPSILWVSGSFPAGVWSWPFTST
jgi:hypothetical protein